MNHFNSSTGVLRTGLTLTWALGLLIGILWVLRPGLAPAASLSRETPVVRAVRLAGPAVVNISTRQAVSQRTNPFRMFGDDDFFKRFFRDFFESYDRQRKAPTSLGSGVIIDGRRGYILTNEHVVVKGSEIKVSLVEVKHVDLPDHMQRAMAKQAESERERRAKVIHADGEFQAAARLRDAAQVIRAHPMAMQMRYLQTLVEVGAEHNTTLVFPVPLELISSFLEKTAGGDKQATPEEPKGELPGAAPSG